ncbi:hypothetical protein HAX54_006242, partial [Datura stramonium]|nr:hypothetical protein [Datura stramonium]
MSIEEKTRARQNEISKLRSKVRTFFPKESPSFKGRHPAGQKLKSEVQTKDGPSLYTWHSE